MLSIVLWALGLLSAAGVGFWGMTLLGFFGSTVAWLVAKNIPWRLVVMALAAFGITLIVFAGWKQYDDTVKSLILTKEKLAQEEIFKDLEKIRADEAERTYDLSKQRVEELESERNSLADETAQLRKTLNEYDLQKDFTNDPVKAVDGLRERNGALNRMLERRSRGEAPARSDPNR
jgi:hypothetical protein